MLPTPTPEEQLITMATRDRLFAIADSLTATARLADLEVVPMDLLFGQLLPQLAAALTALTDPDGAAPDPHADLYLCIHTHSIDRLAGNAGHLAIKGTRRLAEYVSRHGYAPSSVWRCIDNVADLDDAYAD